MSNNKFYIKCVEPENYIEMEPKIKKAVDTFCQIFPPAKIGDYSHATDMKRLLEIAYQVYLAEENVSEKDFEETLTSVHP